MSAEQLAEESERPLPIYSLRSETPEVAAWRPEHEGHIASVNERWQNVLQLREVLGDLRPVSRLVESDLCGADQQFIQAIHCVTVLLSAERASSRLTSEVVNF